jgi:2-dehydropantoate 2-reductase
VTYVVLGAGAVGGVTGARLHRAGHAVTFIARGEHLARIRAQGLVLDTADGRALVPTPAVGSAAEVAWTEETVVLLAVKSQHTEAALDDLATHAPPQTPVVCLQNGVANEPATLRRFAHTYAITVMLPSEHLEPGVVVQGCHPVPGILDVGRYPSGTDQLTERVAADLRSAGFESVPRPDIMAWKYRKLVTNAVGDVSAVLPDADRDEVGSLKRRVRAEGEAVLAAAGIPAVSQEADLERRGDTLRMREDVDFVNSLAQSLRRGGSGLEVDHRAGEIVLLGRLHGVPTPANELVQLLAHQRFISSPNYLSPK